MTHSRRILVRALAVLAASLLYPACVGTPLPDPPSFAALVSWSVTPEQGSLRFVGRAGAVNPGGSTLRFTDPPTAGVLVASNADGSFGRILPGAVGDVIYVERITATDDIFVGAFTVTAGGTLVAASSPDQDGDGTPDAIDCDPTDATRVGQRCGSACRVDSDCASGQSCVGGVCTISSTCTAEVCNGLDDDCDGIVDNGDPNGGVACTPSTGTCPGTLTACGGTCMPIIRVDHETCGNGIDDDCNGIVDDGCP